MKKHIPIFFLFLTISLNCFAQSKLDYNLEIGDTFFIVQKSTQEINQTILSMKQKVINEIGGTMGFEVLDVTNDALTIEMRYRSFTAKMNSPELGELMNIDTSITPKEDDIQALMIQGVIDQPIVFTMTKSGEVISLTGAEGIMDAMLKNGKVNTPEMIEIVKASMEKQWSNTSLSSSIEQMFYVYNQSDKVTGSEWKNEFEGSLSAENNWTLESIDEVHAELSAVSNIEIAINNPGTSMALQGSQKTSVIVNAKTGLFVYAETEGFSEGTGKSSQLPDTDIPVTIKHTNKYTTIN